MHRRNFTGRRNRLRSRERWIARRSPPQRDRFPDRERFRSPRRNRSHERRHSRSPRRQRSWERHRSRSPRQHRSRERHLNNRSPRRHRSGERYHSRSPQRIRSQERFNSSSPNRGEFDRLGSPGLSGVMSITLSQDSPSRRIFVPGDYDSGLSPPRDFDYSERFSRSPEFRDNYSPNHDFGPINPLNSELITESEIALFPNSNEQLLQINEYNEIIYMDDMMGMDPNTGGYVDDNLGIDPNTRIELSQEQYSDYAPFVEYPLPAEDQYITVHPLDNEFDLDRNNERSRFSPGFQLSQQFDADIERSSSRYSPDVQQGRSSPEQLSDRRSDTDNRDRRNTSFRRRKSRKPTNVMDKSSGRRRYFPELYPSWNEMKGKSSGRRRSSSRSPDSRKSRKSSDVDRSAECRKLSSRSPDSRKSRKSSDVDRSAGRRRFSPDVQPKKSDVDKSAGRSRFSPDFQPKKSDIDKSAGRSRFSPDFRPKKSDLDKSAGRSRFSPGSHSQPFDGQEGQLPPLYGYDDMEGSEVYQVMSNDGPFHEEGYNVQGMFGDGSMPHPDLNSDVGVSWRRDDFMTSSVGARSGQLPVMDDSVGNQISNIRQNAGLPQQRLQSSFHDAAADGPGNFGDGSLIHSGSLQEGIRSGSSSYVNVPSERRMGARDSSSGMRHLDPERKQLLADLLIQNEMLEQKIDMMSRLDYQEEEMGFNSQFPNQGQPQISSKFSQQNVGNIPSGPTDLSSPQFPGDMSLGIFQSRLAGRLPQNQGKFPRPVHPASRMRIPSLLGGCYVPTNSMAKMFALKQQIIEMNEQLVSGPQKLVGNQGPKELADNQGPKKLAGNPYGNKYNPKRRKASMIVVPHNPVATKVLNSEHQDAVEDAIAQALKGKDPTQVLIEHVKSHFKKDVTPGFSIKGKWTGISRMRWKIDIPPHGIEVTVFKKGGRKLFKASRTECIVEEAYQNRIQFLGDTLLGDLDFNLINSRFADEGVYMASYESKVITGPGLKLCLPAVEGETALMMWKMDKIPSNQPVIVYKKNGPQLFTALGTMAQLRDEYMDRLEYFGDTEKGLIVFTFKNSCMKDTGVYMASVGKKFYEGRTLVVDLPTQKKKRKNKFAMEHRKERDLTAMATFIQSKPQHERIHLGILDTAAQKNAVPLFYEYKTIPGSAGNIQITGTVKAFEDVCLARATDVNKEVVKRKIRQRAIENLSTKSYNELVKNSLKELELPVEFLSAYISKSVSELLGEEEKGDRSNLINIPLPPTTGSVTNQQIGSGADNATQRCQSSSSNQDVNTAPKKIVSSDSLIDVVDADDEKAQEILMSMTQNSSVNETDFEDALKSMAGRTTVEISFLVQAIAEREMFKTESGLGESLETIRCGTSVTSNINCFNAQQREEMNTRTIDDFILFNGSKVSELEPHAYNILEESAKKCFMLLQWTTKPVYCPKKKVLPFIVFRCLIWIQGHLVGDSFTVSGKAVRNIAAAQALSYIIRRQPVIQFVSLEHQGSFCVTVEEAQKRAEIMKSTEGDFEDDQTSKWLIRVCEDIILQYINESTLDNLEFQPGLPKNVVLEIKNICSKQNLTFRAIPKEGAFINIISKNTNPYQILNILQQCGGSSGKYKLLPQEECEEMADAIMTAMDSNHVAKILGKLSYDKGTNQNIDIQNQNQS